MAKKSMSNEDLRELFEANLKSEGQRLAKEQVPLAIQTLERTMRARKAPASAKVQAAKTILEKAEGRTPQAVPAAPAGSGSGLVVNILQLGTGEASTERIIDLADQGQVPEELAQRFFGQQPQMPGQVEVEIEPDPEPDPEPESEPEEAPWE